MWFWGSVTAWAATWVLMWYTGSVLAAVAYGIATSILGAFGHNWVHQPRYRTWAYLSLDTVGFSSSAWYREHLLQHHMYTNTPWDNHFRGTEPFLVTDPTIKRTWFQGRIMPYLNPLILTLGLYGNWFDHAVATLKGQEAIRPTELILPTNIALIVMRHGFLHGALLTYTWSALLGLWYFSMALMNHNAEHCMDVDARNAARDWGEAQLHSCADWGVALPFHKAWIYLWLNYHTVHHLFPRLDFAHHPAAQAILMRTCQEHNVKYVAADSPVEIYRQMVRSFATPQSLYKALMVYTGDL